jgi:hypothetical protein
VLDFVGDALQVLDIHGGDHVEAGPEQLQYILPAFLVPARSRHVRVGKLVDQGELRLPAQDGVDVHFLQLAAPVLDGLARDDLQAADEFFGQPPAVALDEPDDDIGPWLLAAVSLVQHREGLTDTAAAPR